jgi:hypothetical protein
MIIEMTTIIKAMNCINPFVSICSFIMGTCFGLGGHLHRRNEKRQKKKDVKNKVSKFKNSVYLYLHENYNPKSRDELFNQLHQCKLLELFNENWGYDTWIFSKSEKAKICSVKSLFYEILSKYQDSYFPELEDIWTGPYGTKFIHIEKTNEFNEDDVRYAKSLLRSNNLLELEELLNNEIYCKYVNPTLEEPEISQFRYTTCRSKISLNNMNDSQKELRRQYIENLKNKIGMIRQMENDILQKKKLLQKQCDEIISKLP